MKTKENRLVVADAGWAESLPEWILEEIKSERIMYGMVDIIKGTETVGDAELLAYLYTANLRGPVSHEMAEIYIYLTAKVMQKSKGMDQDGMPDFMKDKLKKGLTEDEQRELNILKQDLYRKRGEEINNPLLNMLRELKKVKNAKIH